MQEQVGRLVPIPDSCVFLGRIGRTKLYELVSAGEIEKVNIGSRAFITRDSLEHFLARLEKPGADGVAPDAGMAEGGQGL